MINYGKLSWRIIRERNLKENWCEKKRICMNSNGKRQMGYVMENQVEGS